MINGDEQISIDNLFRSLTNTKIDETEQFQLSELTPPTNSSTRTTPTPSENMTQQVLRLAEKINDQYLTCKICLV
jgi:hypothetical protein